MVTLERLQTVTLLLPFRWDADRKKEHRSLWFRSGHFLTEIFRFV